MQVDEMIKQILICVEKALEESFLFEHLDGLEWSRVYRLKGHDAEVSTCSILSKS